MNRYRSRLDRLERYQPPDADNSPTLSVFELMTGAYRHEELNEADKELVARWQRAVAEVSAETYDLCGLMVTAEEAAACEAKTGIKATAPTPANR